MKEVTIIFLKIINYIIYPIYILNKKYLKRLKIIINSMLVELEIKIKGQKIGKGFRIGKDSIIKINKNSKLKIGDNVILNDDVYINVRENAILKIGDNVHIGKGVRISAFKSIIIGKDTLIASYCNVLDHNHFFNLKEPVASNKYESSSIVIGEGVWLGTKVQVNKGVTIGEFSVIGANSVVTKDISKSVVCAGVPARKIK